MALKSMKTTKADKAAREKEWDKAGPYSDDYPYELRLTLNNDSLKKLGMSSLPKAGKTVMIEAECSVIGTSVNDRNGKTERRLELQIEKLGVEAADETEEEMMERAIADAGSDD